jgi:serine phosphatase RsbU (regulator of sigma subunit)
MNLAPAPPALTYGVAGRAMPGQAESGDGYVVVPCVDGTLVGVLDGLGHGPLAATATRVAQADLLYCADGSGSDLAALVRRCQEQLTGTRGVVMTVAFFSATSPTMTWLAVGNVAGVLLSADSSGSTRVVLRGGVIGGSLPSLHSAAVALTPGDLVILATDGVASGFAEKVDHDREPAQIAADILTAFAKDSDDALVLVARWSDSS